MRKFLIVLICTAAVLGFVFFYVVPVFQGKVTVAADLNLGVMRIRLYGLTLAAAVLAAFLLAFRLAEKNGLNSSDIDGLLPWVVIFGFLGARLYYVVFSWQYFASDLWAILKVWQGGLAIYGAVIGGIIGLWLYARKRREKFWNFLDLLAIVLPLGQAIGRWGNFFNQEAFGRPTNLPWGMYIVPAHRPFPYLANQFFHPTFLYESLWDIAVFFLLWYLFKRGFGGRTGFLVGSYLILYPLGRFFIESLRLDSFYLSTFRVDQIVSLLAILVGVGILSLKSKAYEKPALENH